MIWGSHLTQTDLEALAQEWQGILRLQDWDIDILLVHHYELEEGAMGSAQYQPTLNCAKIRILRPEEVENEDDQDVEPSLVHELLHVKMAGLHSHDAPLKGEKYRAYESIIEGLAQVLVKLKRRGDRGYLEGKKEGIDQALTLLKKQGGKG